MNLKDKLNIHSTNVNVIKFVCALAVIFSHSFALSKNRDDVLATLNNGQCNIGGVAVAAFFFYSGLYVTKSLSREENMKTFIWKRCKRIFPQLWFVIIVSVIILGPVITIIYNGRMGIKRYFVSPHTWLYLLNGILIPVHNLPFVFEANYYQTVNGPLWTMPIEFILYIALAVIFLVASAISRRTFKERIKCEHTLHVCSFVSFSILLIVLVFVGNMDFEMSVIRPVAIFFEGTVFYDYSDKISLNWVIGVACLVVLVILCKTPFFNIGLVLLFPYAIVSIGLGTKQIGKIPAFISSSYEMYLFGWPIQQIILLFFASDMKPWLNFIIALPFDVILGWGIFEFTERMNDRIKSKK